MKRWRGYGQGEIENPRIDAFLAEIAEVSKRHGLSLGHEDGHGGFEVWPYDESNIEWLNAASDCVTEPDPVPPRPGPRMRLPGR